MKQKINSYFAILLITLAGSGATLLIEHFATAASYGAFSYDEGPYKGLLK